MKGLFDVLHSSFESGDLNVLKKLNTSFKKNPRYIPNNSREYTGFLIEHFCGEVR